MVSLFRPHSPLQAHDIMSSILSEGGRSTHCSHYNHFIAACTHMYENATVSVLHISHFTCSSVKDQGYAYCSQKGKGIHWGKVRLFCALEGPIFFVPEVSASDGPSALSTELHSSSHAKPCSLGAVGYSTQPGVK